MSGLVLYVDPGLHGCGAALFDGAELVHAEYTTALGGQAHPILEPAAGVEALIIGAGGSLDYLVVERPKIYDSAHQKGDQQDIADLLVVAGSILRVGAQYARNVLAIEPWSWKGQTPKDVTAARVDKHLTADERVRIVWPAASLRHNVIDAIGIGLWDTKRSGR